MEPSDLQRIATAREAVKGNPNVVIDEDAVVIHPEAPDSEPCAYVAAWIRVPIQGSTEHNPAARV